MTELPINKIVCGDNVATMATFPAQSIDLVVTSPPYDNLRTYGGHTWDFENVAQQLWRVIKPGGVVVWVVNDATVNGSETGTSFRQALRFMEIGFRLHDTMIYEKDGIAFPDQCRYQQCWEYMFVFSSGEPANKNLIQDRENVSFGRKVTGTDREADGTTRKASCCGNAIKKHGVRWNLWRYNNTAGNAEKKHPAQFPEALARDHILSWSNEGDIVLDPFSGSGTTAKMAKHNGRKYIGIEINPEYCEIAAKRLEQQVFEFGD
jgi:site-specific DNA-methyltransferase (adenine-specific)